MASHSRKGSRSRSSHVEPLISPLDFPKPSTNLVFSDNEFSKSNRRDTDSFVRHNTDSFINNYYKTSITPPISGSNQYESSLNINNVSKMCMYYIIIFISFALIILFIIRISSKNKLNHKSIDIALCMVSSFYFISVIIISIIFIHQYLYKIIDKDQFSFSIKYDPHPSIRYMPRGKSLKLTYFIKTMFFQFNRYQISVFFCFIHELISSVLYAIQYNDDYWNIAFSLNKLLASFGFILPSICVHTYCAEKNFISNHFWRNSEVSNTMNSSQQQQRMNQTEIDRETKAIAASISVFSNKMLMGSLCFGYIVQIVLFMADPFWNLTFYDDIEGTQFSNNTILTIFDINQLIFRSFAGIFLSETIIVIMFVIMDKHYVNQSFYTLKIMLHPIIYIILFICILIELFMAIIFKKNINDWIGIYSFNKYRHSIEIILNSFWMFIHMIIIIILLKWAVIGKLIYEEKVKRKISVFFAYVPSTISWFVTESILLLLICVCYLTQISLHNGYDYIYSHRFDIYRQWIIYAFLGIEMVLFIQLKQIQRCQSFKIYFNNDNNTKSTKNYIRYFKLLAFINVFDFFYIIIFVFDFFYREYKQYINDKNKGFESFAFAFSFGLPALLLLNLSNLIECYINWTKKEQPHKTTTTTIEMSKSGTLTFPQ